ncbi:MAG TPA: hypothetical protein ENJ95_18020 [Bacteroidetes bacterium]|nr:hypothetical protein [Bacteroidota bacterium]
MRNFPASIFAFAFMLTFFACQKDETAAPITVQESAFPNVDPALWPYYEAFEKEGAERGLVIDLAADNILGKIEELPEEHVAGQCSYGTAVDSEVTIDQGFWNDFSSHYIREMVVFHELGHCYLKRGHKEGAHPDGTCLSIMRSGLEDCRDNYNLQTREEYLDELFGSAVIRN